DASDANDAKVGVPRLENTTTYTPTTGASEEGSGGECVPPAAHKWNFASFASLKIDNGAPAPSVVAGQTLVSDPEGGSDANRDANRQFASPLGAPSVVDIETGDAKDLTQRYRQGPGFFRIGGVHRDGQYRHTADPADLARTLADSKLIVGHNLLAFDLPVIAREAPGRLDLLKLAHEGRVLDTMVADSLLNPPSPGVKPEQAMRTYSLEASCDRHGVPGKVDDLKALAKKHGGFDRIPLDDIDYLDYLREIGRAHV